MIRLKNADPEIDRHRYEWARIRLEEPSGAGIRALVSALCHCGTMRHSGGWIRREAVFDHQYPMRIEGGRVCVMEDLPVGSVVTVMGVFADTLALLLEHDVPMDEAVTLATSSSGDRRIRESGQVLAERIRRGEKPSTGDDLVGAPPMLVWLLFHHRDRGRLVRSLRRIADLSRRHAEWMSRWLSVYLPTWLTIGLGGSLALAYALCVIVPWVRLMIKLAEPQDRV